MKRFRSFCSQHLHDLYEAKGKANVGEMYEFILAAATVALFTDRDTKGKPYPVDRSSVVDVMREYFAGKKNWTVEVGRGGRDLVELEASGVVGLSLTAVQNALPLLDRDIGNEDLDLIAGWKPKSLFKTIEDLIATSIDAVNRNKTLKDLSTQVITNGEEDDVVVKCVGTSGAMKTKSDIDVYVNDVELRSIGISVKLETVKQVDQAAGVDAVANLKTIFDRFGIPYGSNDFNGVKDAMDPKKGFVGVYTDRSPSKDKNVGSDKRKVFDAVMASFNKVASSLISRGFFKKEPAVKTLMQGLRVAATKGEADVEVIKGRMSYDQNTFNVLSKGVVAAANGNNVSAKAELSSARGDREPNPSIGFYAGLPGQEQIKIFKLRFRFDADRKGDVYNVRFRFLVELEDISDFLDQLENAAPSRGRSRR